MSAYPGVFLGMDFKTFYLGLPRPDREAFAAKIGSTVGYCHQLAYGKKQVELGMADVIVASSGGVIEIEALPLTERARFQRVARIAPQSEASAQQGA